MPVNAPPYRLLSPDPAINHIHGLASAQVTITEYGDFEFASCFQAYTALKLALSHFGAQVRFVFRHFPVREVRTLSWPLRRLKRQRRRAGSGRCMNCLLRISII